MQPPAMTEAPNPPRGPPEVFHAFAAAAQTWRANPWSVLLMLGVVSLVWAVPWILYEETLKAVRVGLWGPVLMIVESLWWAPVLAVQLRFALVLSRGHRLSAHDLFKGLRMSGSMAVISGLWILPFALSDLLPETPGEDIGWREGVGFAVALAGIYFFVRLSMAPVLAADARRGPFWALANSWVLTTRRFWPLVGFGLLHLVVLLLLYLLTGGRRPASFAIFDLGICPLSCLAYVSLYLTYADQPRHVADG